MVWTLGLETSRLASSEPGVAARPVWIHKCLADKEGTFAKGPESAGQKKGKGKKKFTHVETRPTGPE